MSRIQIPVGLLEFNASGHTIWVQSDQGTVLRIKCSGRIIVDEACQNNVAHADIYVEGNINICLPPESDEDDAHE